MKYSKAWREVPKFVENLAKHCDTRTLYQIKNMIENEVHYRTHKRPDVLQKQHILDKMKSLKSQTSYKIKAVKYIREYLKTTLKNAKDILEELE